MSAVEFLDPDEHTSEPEAASVDTADEPRTARLVLLADAVLSLGGAALLVVACFRNVFTIDLGVDEGPDNYGVDGWGRLNLSRGDIAGQHSARIGVVLCVAAGLIVLGVALRVRGAWRTVHRIGTSLTLLGAGAAAAMTGNAVLDGAAALDSYRAAISGELELTPGEPGAALPTVHFGGFVWLAGIGAACAVLAAVVTAAAGIRTRETAPATAPATVHKLPELTADDEQL